jgi:hypothetical protein
MFTLCRRHAASGADSDVIEPKGDAPHNTGCMSNVAADLTRTVLGQE